MDTSKIALRDLNADWIRAMSWDLPYVTAEDADDMLTAFDPEVIWELVENELPAGIPMPEELRAELREILPPRESQREADDEEESPSAEDAEMAEMAASVGNWPFDPADAEMAGRRERDISHVPRDYFGRWTRRRDLPGPPGEALSDRFARVRETVLDPDIADAYRTDITEKDENGNWTPERTAMHDQIVDEYLAAHEHIPRENRAIILGGLGGAGKTYLLRNNGEAADALGLELAEDGTPTNFMVVNADDFKSTLHDHGAIPEVDGLLPGEAAVFVHEEASWISRRVADRAQSEGINLAWDYTMGSEGSVASRIDPLVDEIGPKYDDIRVVFVDVSADHSVESARGRWERGVLRDPDGFGGRFVPEDFIRAAADTDSGNNSRNRDAFEAIKGEDWVGGWMLWDNDRHAGRLIDSTLGGESE